MAARKAAPPPRVAAAAHAGLVALVEGRRPRRLRAGHARTRTILSLRRPDGRSGRPLTSHAFWRSTLAARGW